MRRKDRETNAADAWSVVDRCAYATVALLDPAGEPYCVPVSIAREGTNVYFHCAREGLKTDCLRAHPGVCVSCVADVRPEKRDFATGYASATLRGTAAEVTDEAERLSALRQICARYTPDNMAAFDAYVAPRLTNTAVWRIAVADITGKRRRANPD